MQYLFLLYGAEASESDPSPGDDGFEEYLAPWMEYDKILKEAGVFVGGEALQPASTATMVTLGDGKPVFTDGPYAETKEQLGGYYVVDCENLDEALSWASKCPGAKHGSIEVRPIMKFG